MVSQIGSGNLSGKTYKGAIAGWGNLTGPEVLEHMMNKALFIMCSNTSGPVRFPHPAIAPLYVLPDKLPLPI